MHTAPSTCSHEVASDCDLIRPQRDDSKSGHHRSHSKPESQAAVAQRTQNHPGGHSQNSKGSYTQAAQGMSSQTYQEQNQDLRHLAAQPTPPGRRAASPPEWRDPYTPELCSGDRRRYEGWLGTGEELHAPIISTTLNLLFSLSLPFLHPDLWTRTVSVRSRRCRPPAPPPALSPRLRLPRPPITLPATSATQRPCSTSSWTSSSGNTR